MRAQEERELRSFIDARLMTLRRAAYLLCGDRHGAEDIVGTVLAKLVRQWTKVRRLEHPDGYVRRMLVTAYLDERRRPWRREHPTEHLPDRPLPPTDITDRLTLMDGLARLPRRRRAVLVLRFFEDLSVEETARVLGCTAGTIKAHTHQGLADLRAIFGPQAAMMMEER